MNNIETYESIFNNKVFDLVRCFGITQHYEGAEAAFKFKNDPAKMIYATKGKKLFATVDTEQKISDMNMFEIAELNSLETLLKLPDEYISELKKRERYEESLFLNEELIFAVEEFITKKDRAIFGHIAQLHLQLIGMAYPPKQFVSGLKLLVHTINDKTADVRDVNILKAMLSVTHEEYKGLIGNE